MNKHIWIKTVTVIGFTFLLLTTTQSYAQGNSNKKNAERLIGTWVLDYDKTLQGIKQTSRDYYNTLKAEKKEKIQSSFEQRKMHFSQDGTYTLVVNAELQVTGSWQLKEDDITLEIILSGSDKVITQSIEHIDTNKMILALGGSDASNSLFDKWHLEKITQ
jgi:hypothetical protein